MPNTISQYIHECDEPEEYSQKVVFRADEGKWSLVIMAITDKIIGQINILFCPYCGEKLQLIPEPEE